MTGEMKSQSQITPPGENKDMMPTVNFELTQQASLPEYTFWAKVRRPQAPWVRRACLGVLLALNVATIAFFADHFTRYMAAASMPAAVQSATVR